MPTIIDRLENGTERHIPLLTLFAALVSYREGLFTRVQLGKFLDVQGEEEIQDLTWLLDKLDTAINKERFLLSTFASLGLRANLGYHELREDGSSVITRQKIKDWLTAASTGI